MLSRPGSARAGEAFVDRAALLDAARHRRNEERRPERLTEHGGGGVDGIGIELGEGRVCQAEPLEAVGHALRAHILVQVDAEVVGFPACGGGGRVLLGHGSSAEGDLSDPGPGGN